MCNLVAALLRVLHGPLARMCQCLITQARDAATSRSCTRLLQHFERWDIHSEGTQPSVRAVTDRLDTERMAVREALGYAAPHFPLADHYRNDQWMYGDAHRKLQKSGDWREHIDLQHHRYVSEDIELGLAFLASVARWAGVDAPVAHGLLALTGAWLGRDLRQGARTLEGLGLASLGPDALHAMLEKGEAR